MSGVCSDVRGLEGAMGVVLAMPEASGHGGMGSDVRG